MEIVFENFFNSVVNMVRYFVNSIFKILGLKSWTVESINFNWMYKFLFILEEKKNYCLRKFYIGEEDV